MAAPMVWRTDDGRFAFGLRFGFSRGAAFVLGAGAVSRAKSSRSAMRRLLSFASSSAIFARMRSIDVSMIPSHIVRVIACYSGFPSVDHRLNQMVLTHQTNRAGLRAF